MESWIYSNMKLVMSDACWTDVDMDLALSMFTENPWWIM